jgi:hypothetical protein
MKLAHSIKVSVFIKSEENEVPVREKLLSLFPFNFEEEKLILNRSKAQGFNQRQIIIYEVNLEKERHTNAFLKFLREKLDEQQKEMLMHQENRLDEECNFFLRLDKQSLLNNSINITDCGECFHIRISIAAFPKKKEAALEVVKKIFS